MNVFNTAIIDDEFGQRKANSPKAGSLLSFCADVYGHDAAQQAMEMYIAPADLFHNGFKRGRVGESGERMGQVVIFLEGFAENAAEERGQSVEVQVEEGAQYFARRVADFQADDATARAHHAQHLAKALPDISQVAHGESGAAAIDAIVGQVDLLSITHAQVDAFLQPQPRQLAPPYLKHLRRNIHTDHPHPWRRVANDGDGEISRSCPQIKPGLPLVQRQAAGGKGPPAPIQPEAHQVVHGIIDTRNAPEETPYIRALAAALTKFFL